MSVDSDTPVSEELAASAPSRDDNAAGEMSAGADGCGALASKCRVLAPPFTRCAHPRLQEAIAAVDLPRLDQLVARIAAVGAPQRYAAAFRAWEASPAASAAAGHGASCDLFAREEAAVFASEVSADEGYRVGGLPYGADAIRALPDREFAAVVARCEGESASAEERAALWPLVLRRLSQLCSALLEFLDGSFPYVVPSRARAALVPLLYAWVVDWPVALRRPREWDVLSKCFRRVGRVRRSTPRLPCADVEPLPWRPLADLVAAVSTPHRHIEKTHTFELTRQVVGAGLQSVCATASQFFDAEALGQMRDHYAPFFSRGSVEGSLALQVFAELLPVHCLTDPQTGSATPRARRVVVDWLFKGEAYYWQQGKPWALSSIHLLSRAVVSNGDIFDFDAAEPFFTLLLTHFELPIGDYVPPPLNDSTYRRSYLDPISLFQFPPHAMAKDAAAALCHLLPPTTANSPMWNHFVRFLHAVMVFLRPSSGCAPKARELLDFLTVFLRAATRRVNAEQAALLRHGEEPPTPSASAVRDSADVTPSAQAQAAARSRYWTAATRAHLVRLLLPTAVAAAQIGAASCAELFASLCYLDAAVTLPELLRVVGAATEEASTDAQKILVTSLLSRSTYLFLQQDGPVSDPLEGASSEEEEGAAAAAAAKVSPASLQLDVGDSTVRAVFLSALQKLLPAVVGWMNPSQANVTTSVMSFLFCVASAVGRLADVVGGEEAETELLGTFVRQAVAFFNLSSSSSNNNNNNSSKTHRSGGGGSPTAALHHCQVVLESASEAAFGPAADVIARETLTRGSPASLAMLFAVVAKRDPQRAFRAVKPTVLPLLTSPTADDDAVLWASVVLGQVVAGAGLAAVSERLAVYQCIQGCVQQVTSSSRVAAAGEILCMFAAAMLKARCDDRDKGVDPLEGSARFTKAAEAPLRWQLPTQEHTSAIVSLVDALMDDVVHVVENIQCAECPSANAATTGLRALLPGGTANGESATSVPSVLRLSSADTSPTAAEFTPRNILNGIALWMCSLCNVTETLYRIGEAASSSSSLSSTAPLFALTESITVRTSKRASTTDGDAESIVVCATSNDLQKVVWVPQPVAKLPRRSPEDLFEFVRVHFLRRALGDWETEMTHLFGPAALKLLDTRLIDTALPPLAAAVGAPDIGASHEDWTGGGDADDDANHEDEAGSDNETSRDAATGRSSAALKHVFRALSICSGVCDFRVVGESVVPLDDGGSPLRQHYHNCYPRSIYTKMRFPPCYWALTAEVLQNRPPPRRVPRRLMQDFRNIGHLLIFSAPGGLPPMAFAELLRLRHSTLESLLGIVHVSTLRDLVGSWFARHAPQLPNSDAALSELAVFRGMTASPIDTTTVAEPSGNEHRASGLPPADGAAGKLAVSRGKRFLNLPFRLLWMTLHATPRNPHLFEYATRALCFFPDLMSTHPQGLHPLMMMMPNRAVMAGSSWSPLTVSHVVDRMVTVAGRVAGATPGRAADCLARCSGVFCNNPHTSEATLRSLANLSLSAHPNVRCSAQNLLTAALRALLPAPAQTVVQMRFCDLDDMELSPDGGATDGEEARVRQQARDAALRLYNYRLKRLREHFPLTNSGPRSQHYLPRTLTVAAVVPSDFFADATDGHTALCETAPVFHCHLDRCAHGGNDDEDNREYQRQHNLCVNALRTPLTSLFLGGAETIAAFSRLVVTAAEGPQKGGTMVASSPVRETWLWRLAESREDMHESMKPALPPLVWHPVAEILGAEVAAVALPALVDALLEDYAHRAADPAVNRESFSGLFANAFDVSFALLAYSAREWTCRRAALATLRRLMRFALDPRVPNEITSVLLVMCINVGNELTVGELWDVLELLLSVLEAHQHDLQTQSRAMRCLFQLVYEFGHELCGAVLPQLVARVRRSKAIFLSSTISSTRVHYASFLRQIIRLAESQSELLESSSHNRGVVNELVADLRSDLSFLFDTPCTSGTAAANAAAQSLHAPSQAQHPHPDSPTRQEEPWRPSPTLGANPFPSASLLATPAAGPQAAPSAGGAFTVSNPRAFARPPTIEPLPSRTPALRPATVPAAELTPGPAVAAAGAALQQFSLGSAAAAAEAPVFTPDKIATMETICVLFGSPSYVTVTEWWPFVLELCARCLDASLPEAEKFFTYVSGTVLCLPFVRVSRDVAQAMVRRMCDIVVAGSSTHKHAGGAADGCPVPYGTSRRAKVTFTRALRLMLFNNLHRIGKFDLMTRVAEAALAAFAHGDGPLRTEGKMLFAVLLRVTAVPQAEALLRTYTRRLRDFGSGTSTPAGDCASGAVSARRERISLVLALCAALLADPGPPPPYTPALVDRLLPLAADSAPEVSGAVRRAIEEWWRAHRAAWKDHKRLFTPAQIDGILTVVASPSHYA